MGPRAGRKGGGAAGGSSTASRAPQLPACLPDGPRGSEAQELRGEGRRGALGVGGQGLTRTGHPSGCGRGPRTVPHMWALRASAWGSHWLCGGARGGPCPAAAHWEAPGGKRVGGLSCQGCSPTLLPGLRLWPWACRLPAVPGQAQQPRAGSRTHSAPGREAPAPGLPWGAVGLRGGEPCGRFPVPALPCLAAGSAPRVGTPQLEP